VRRWKKTTHTVGHECGSTRFYIVCSTVPRLPLQCRPCRNLESHCNLIISLCTGKVTFLKRKPASRIRKWVGCPAFDGLSPACGIIGRCCRLGLPIEEGTTDCASLYMVTPASITEPIVYGWHLHLRSNQIGGWLHFDLDLSPSEAKQRVRATCMNGIRTLRTHIYHTAVLDPSEPAVLGNSLTRIGGDRSKLSRSAINVPVWCDCRGDIEAFLVIKSSGDSLSS
jgi:hypothetical protein